MVDDIYNIMDEKYW